MDIVAYAVHPYDIPLVSPLATASGRHTRRRGWLLSLRLAEGTEGWGEAAPLPGHGGEAPERAAEAVDEIGRHLVASTATDGWRVPETFAGLRAFAALLAQRWPDAPAARAAAECALADLAARKAGVPLARWLDAAARGHVWLNATVGAVSPRRAGRAAAAAAQEGYRAVKVKVGTADVADLQRLAAVRRAVGGRVLVRADANGAWDPDRAEVMLDALAAHRVEYVEQPVPAERVEELALLRRQAGTPVAADESLLLPDGPARVLAADAADVLVLKPSLLGGLTAAWCLAEQASARGMSVVVTSSLEAAVGRMAACHLAAALPGADRPHGLATGQLLATDVAEGPGPERGRIRIPAGPGLGIAP